MYCTTQLTNHKDKKLLASTFIGILFVSILGTLAHFIYEWTGNNPVAGLFTPVNESTWEHMKLLFFPMLLYLLFIPSSTKSEYPCILSALLSAALAGFCLIPVLFYTYTGILGYHTTFLDIATFYISVILSFYLFYRLSLSCKADRFVLLLKVITVVITILFFIFTFFPPGIALFQSP